MIRLTFRGLFIKKYIMAEAKKSAIKLLEPKYVTIGDAKIPVKLTFRAMMMFEELAGVPVQFAISIEHISMLFFCAAKAGAKGMNVPFDYEYESFIDFIDNHPESLDSFYEAIKEGEPEEKKKITKR